MKSLVTSRAEIIRPTASQMIRVISWVNPETVAIQLLRDYFVGIGFSQMFPNFLTVNIGAVHPFILLMWNELQGSDTSMNLFPSITVSDSSFSEGGQLLARDATPIVIDQDQVALWKNFRSTNEVFVSDDGLNAMDVATKNGGLVSAIMYKYINDHQFDLNIWSDNKDVTSFLFDACDAFISSSIGEFHLHEIDMTGKSGRRSGDVNMEFGSLLYGANITISATIVSTCVSVDIEEGIIDSVDTITNPTYHVVGG